MKKLLKITLGVILSAVILFAFAGCGGSSEAEPTPADEATAALDTTLAALKSADMDAIKALSGGEDVFKDAEESFGSEEGIKDVLTAMFGHFDYKLGTPEQVDDTHINIPATVSNADMNKAVSTWFSDLMSYAISNPEIANDEEALQAKTIEVLKSSVDATAEAENGIISQDVVFPMELIDGNWEISDKIDDGVLDAILGGFMGAISELQSGSSGDDQ